MYRRILGQVVRSKFVFYKNSISNIDLTGFPVLLVAFAIVIAFTTLAISLYAFLIPLTMSYVPGTYDYDQRTKQENREEIGKMLKEADTYMKYIDVQEKKQKPLAP